MKNNLCFTVYLELNNKRKELIKKQVVLGFVQQLPFQTFPGGFYQYQVHVIMYQVHVYGRNGAWGRLCSWQCSNEDSIRGSSAFSISGSCS